MITAEALAALEAELIAGRDDAGSWIEPPEMARAFVAMYDEALRRLRAAEFAELAGVMGALKAATRAAGHESFGAGLGAGS